MPDVELGDIHTFFYLIPPRGYIISFNEFGS